MQNLPTKLYRAEQVRELDRIAIEQHGVPGLELMHRAGQASFDAIRQRWPDAHCFAVFCGAGNNAGDGYVVARLALLAGLEATVYTLLSPEKLHGDALLAYKEYQASGGMVLPFASIVYCKADVVVDALLGTGLDRPVKGEYAEAIAYIDSLQKPVVALDIPSGLNADTGMVMGCAVQASCTVTFIALKQGLLTGVAADYCGELVFAALEMPEAVYRAVPHAATRVIKPHFPPRKRSAHKGMYGHVLIIGGDRGYAGAARMAAEAAARAGAGLVSIASRERHAALLNAACPELMCHGVETPLQLAPLLAKATVAVIGPGLGQSQWAQDLFESALLSGCPLIVDADALNLLAQRGPKDNPKQWVLTPHPGEAARLLGCTAADIQDDRFAAVCAIQEKYAGICLLKGAGSLIANGAEIYVNATGNPGMASGGMGDVLSGVIAGLVAQGYTIDAAARFGAYIHGAAADLAAVNGERGLLASDLLPHLRKLVNT
ncbi:MAG: NAD(P)H-hydrate dehydratase [Gammaproteobacteria bacterium]